MAEDDFATVLQRDTSHYLDSKESCRTQVEGSFGAYTEDHKVTVAGFQTQFEDIPQQLAPHALKDVGEISEQEAYKMICPGDWSGQEPLRTSVPFASDNHWGLTRIPDFALAAVDKMVAVAVVDTQSGVVVDKELALAEVDDREPVSAAVDVAAVGSQSETVVDKELALAEVDDKVLVRVAVAVGIHLGVVDKVLVKVAVVDIQSEAVVDREPVSAAAVVVGGIQHVVVDKCLGWVAVAVVGSQSVTVVDKELALADVDDKVLVRVAVVDIQSEAVVDRVLAWVAAAAVGIRQVADK
jgi:hypothetical protein